MMIASPKGWLAFVLGGSLAGGFSVAGAPPATQAADPIAQPIAQLADPQWRLRSRAAEELIQMGELARPRLELLLNKASDAGLRTRVESVLRRIELVRQFGATPITLHLRSSPPREAFDAMLTQAKLKLSDHGEMLDHLNGPAVTLDLDRKPLWLALREICARTGVQVDSVSQEGELSLESGHSTWSSRPAVCQGPFLVVAQQFDLTRRVDGNGANVGAAEYDLSLLAFAEPKLHPVCWWVSQVQGVTDTGTPVLIGRRRYWGAGSVNSSPATRLQLINSDDRAVKLGRLSFTAAFVLQMGSETIEVPNILSIHNETRLVGGWRVIVREMIQGGDGHYSVAVSICRDGHTVSEWGRLLGVIGRLAPRVIDAQGTELRSWGGSRSVNDEQWTLTDRLIRNPPGAPPSKLLWEFPTSLKQTQVPIEFKDLPLPR